MSTYRYLSLLAFIVAALALPSSAGAAPGAIFAQDHEEFGFVFTDASQTNPQDNSVTVSPGETVTFSYPTGTSVHNVAFNATGPQPASCQQTLPTPSAPGNPPLPAGPSLPGWAGLCTFANPGTYVFYCVAHQAMTGTVVVAANQSPTVTASRNPSGDVTTGTSVSFSATGTDANGDPLTYAWDFGDGGTASGANASHAYAVAGTYSAKVTVSDGRGGTGEATLSVVVTQGNRAPTVTGSRNPAGNVVAGTAVQFSAVGTDADGDTLTYSWAFGDTGTSTAQNPSHTYAAVGSFTATVTVSDGRGGTGSATVPVTVTADGANQDPTVTASRTPTGNPRVGIPLSFTATGTDPDGDTLSYSWNFGDGETSTQQNPTHAFLSAATFNVVVTVSDGRGGTGTATLPVIVQANRAPTISAATATPAEGIAPLNVQFAATATDPDGHALTYEWDLDGNGSFETTGANPARTYTTATSSVLRVSDAFGGSVTRTLVINPLPQVLDPAAKFNVLVFSKTGGFRHSNIDEGNAAIKLLGSQQNFTVDAIEDASLFTDAFLARYDAVIFNSTTGEVLNDAQQAAFERFIRAGHGYVGVHSAADTEYTWAWYGQMVGGYFRNHPNGTPTATVVVEDASRPSTSHLPARWTRVDEWYNYQGIVNPVVNGGGTDVSTRDLTPIHVLLTMDESTYAEADGTDGVDDDHPIAWCKRYDGGRMFYTGLAHTEASWVEANFLQHFLGGLEVAAGYVSDAACGNTSPTVTSDVGATVPFTLALSIDGPAKFGTIMPGVTAEYATSVAANVTSTAGEATLAVTDPSSTATGRLVNGTYVLESPLQVRATNAANGSTAFASVAGSASPLTLLTYPRAISADQVTLAFKQPVGATETLRAGSYGKSLTFTLSTTTP